MPLNTNQDQKRLRTTKFPPEFDRKVDSTKVNFNVMKLWINEQLHEHMGIDDDIVKDLIVELIETVKYPDIKSLQIQLVGFLDEKAPPFCKELWNLLLDAQASEQGVPQKLIAAKKDEMQRQRAEKERARAMVSRRQQDDFEARGREADEARAREDKERYYRRQQMRGGKPPSRVDRDLPRYRRESTRSPSPRRRRDSDDFRRPPPRGVDSYVPPPSDGSNKRRRSRSPGPDRGRDRSLSRTRSPEPRRRRNDSPPRRRNESPPRRRRSPSPPPRRRRGRDDSRSPSPQPRRRTYRDDRSSSPPVKRRSGRPDRSRSPAAARRINSPHSLPRDRTVPDLFDPRKSSGSSSQLRLSPVDHRSSGEGDTKKPEVRKTE